MRNFRDRFLRSNNQKFFVLIFAALSSFERSEVQRLAARPQSVGCARAQRNSHYKDLKSNAEKSGRGA
jgi:hypothetical protein